VEGDRGVLAHGPLRSVRSLDLDAVEEPKASPAVYDSSVEGVSLHRIAGAKYRANHTLLGGGCFEDHRLLRAILYVGLRRLAHACSNAPPAIEILAESMLPERGEHSHQRASRARTSRAPSALSTRAPCRSRCRSRSYPLRSRPRARRHR
jgi:hypothetical protein